MLYATSLMVDLVGELGVNKTLALKDGLNMNAVKEEICKDDDFVDVKVQISETAIITEVQDNLICDKIKQYDVATTLDNIKIELSLPEIQYGMIRDNIKIEEGKSADNVKTEFNNGLLYCEDCQIYRKDYCAECEMLIHILNKNVPTNADNKSREELPNNILEIRDYFGEFHVFALKVIPVGVKFGPFTGLNRTECSWKLKGGKFVINKCESKYLNWMQYTNPARNFSEQNLQVFQHEHDLYYESTRKIEEGDELLVYFGEEYEESINRNVEVDFIPTTVYIFKDAFACTFCCLGFSSTLYLAKHKTICPGNAAGDFTIEELTQCPSCKIHLDRKEYLMHHMACCSKINDRKCIVPTTGDRTAQVNEQKTRPRRMHKCHHCEYKTMYKGDLQHHTNQHYEVKMFKCEICCRRFKTKEVLRLHVRNTQMCAAGKEDLEQSMGFYTKAHVNAEDEMKQFKCTLCEFRTKFKTSVKRHKAAKHLTAFKYKCDTCEYKSNLKSCLKRHIETKHAKEYKYKCDSCDYKANLKFQLKSHIETRHLKEFKHKCDACDYETNWMSSLKRHVERRHSKEFRRKCDVCDYETNVKSYLKAHIETKHLKESKYKCDACDYKTNMKPYLKNHIETRHLTEFKYKCDTCAYKTNVKSRLKTHVDIRHLKEFKYKCDICDYKMNFKSVLKKHIETRHLKEFKYKCDSCDYKSNQKLSLMVHVKAKHLNEFNYKCDICDYKTNFKFSLNRHINTKHLKEFKYECDRCEYKTYFKCSLKTHIETMHLNEFKHKCDACDYKSNRKWHLKNHIETKHLKVFKYKCDTCQYKTNWESNLKNHIQARHSLN